MSARREKKSIKRRWHSSALLFCVKSEEAIGDPSAKTRQRRKLLLAGNRCLRESWHSTTILLLTEINKRNTRDTPWLSPNERETLKYTGRLACKHFLIFTPPKHLTARAASVCGPRVKMQRILQLPQLSIYKKAKLSSVVGNMDEESVLVRERQKKKKPKYIKLTAPILLLERVTTCSSSILYMHRCIHKQTYTHTHKSRYRMLADNSVNTPHIPY